MKKIKLFLFVALFGAMSFGAFSAYEHYTMSEEERFFLANVEALTITEPGGSTIGRWRTVGCGGNRLDQWKTFCCPSSSYNNCPSAGDCKLRPIYGCD